MATFTTTTDRFPAGTTVTVYPESNWPTAGRPPSGAPIGSSTTSAAVGTDSTLTFTGLADDTVYYMTASISGTYRYVRFTTARPVTPMRASGTPSNGQGVVWNSTSESWDAATLANVSSITDGYLVKRSGSSFSSVAESALAIPKYDRTYGQIGMWCIPNMLYTYATVTPAASTYRLARFMPTRNMTITKIGFIVTAQATSNDSVDIGLYDSSGTRLVSSGATSGKVNAGTGKFAIDISSTSLTAGTVYYAGFAYGTIGGTAATLAAISGSTAAFPTMWGTTAGTLEISAANSGATLPSTAAMGTTSSVAPLMAVLES